MISALGAARILGYDLIENFQAPFESRSFGEFLAPVAYLDDEAGSAIKSTFRWAAAAAAPWRHYLNIVIVFLCSGLWHGADWRYLAWGLACGLVSALCGADGQTTARALAAHNPLYRAAWFKTLWQVLCTNVLFCLTLVFLPARCTTPTPLPLRRHVAGVAEVWPAAWGRSPGSLLDTGLDGRLPVVLWFGCFVVFAQHAI